ncbi:MAG: YafY family protein [Actinomycetota bacterium]|nr:YafY family protein [Actinomycetota bacterium]MDI7252551.1 YafY family protein [Actinomycetota bacterium]
MVTGTRLSALRNLLRTKGDSASNIKKHAAARAARMMAETPRLSAAELRSNPRTRRNAFPEPIHAFLSMFACLSVIACHEPMLAPAGDRSLPGQGGEKREGGRSGVSKLERLMNLIAMLLEARRPVTLEQIRNSIPGYQQESAASFKRMFERDKSELREMGIPIRVEPLDAFGEETGYRIPKEEYYLPEVNFTPEEKVALLLVHRFASGGLIPLSREASSALLKLSPDLGGAGPLREARPAPVRFDHPAESVEKLSALWEASVRRKTVRFAYRSLGSSKPRERRLDPYGMYFDRGAWYVVGYCHLRGERRSFRVSRVESEVVLEHPDHPGPDFEKPPDFKLSDYSRVLPWEFEEGSPQEAEVRLSPRIAWWVERDLGDIYPFRYLEDGSGVIRVTVRNEDAFCNWVLSFAEDAEVISPRNLRERIRNRLLDMLRGLEGGQDGRS